MVIRPSQRTPDAVSASAWPEQLWLVRHGESLGNLARNVAEAAGGPSIDIAGRDADVPLSALGARQARAVGRWFGQLPVDERPTLVLSSPYRRSVETTEWLGQAAGLDRNTIPYSVDERLREKDFGMLNRLTKAGILARYPEQAALRAHLGKFYYRPPSGESWCDVVLRLRSLVDQIQLQHAQQRILVVTHQVIVLCFRYLLERMTKAQIMEIDQKEEVANCSVTSYQRASDPDSHLGMTLHLYNFISPLETAGESVTNEPDIPMAPR